MKEKWLDVGLQNVTMEALGRCCARLLVLACVLWQEECGDDDDSASGQFGAGPIL